MRVYTWAEHHPGEGEKFNMALNNADWLLRVPMHSHLDFCEWVFVVSGKMRHEINGVTTVDERGAVTLVRPNDIHCHKGKDFSAVTLNVFPSWLRVFDVLWGTPNLCKRLFNTTRPPRIQLSEEECRTMEELCMKVLAFRHGILARQHVTAFLSTILARQFNSYLKDDDWRMKNAPAWFKETVEWLDNNADKEITLKQLRQKACRCPAHISREFMKQLQCTPTEYLLRQKLIKAENLLLSSSLSILEIAMASGFPNLSHFCRCFKQHYKNSPRKYREFYTSVPTENTPNGHTVTP